MSITALLHNTAPYDKFYSIVDGCSTSVDDPFCTSVVQFLRVYGV
jgi:hypothetical protein